MTDAPTADVPPPAPHGDATAPRRPPAPAPFSRDELRAALTRPGRALEVALGDGPRLRASIDDGAVPWRLVQLLAACATLAALPYGFVLGASAWWKIATLYAGSMLLCWPSLQVFGTYLGSRRQPMQTLALALTVASTAALFTFGFAPILWFLDVTMASGDRINARDAGTVLLALAFAGGLRHGSRCFSARDEGVPRALSFAIWLLLVTFVTCRMARTLDLLP